MENAKSFYLHTRPRNLRMNLADSKLNRAVPAILVAIAMSVSLVAFLGVGTVEASSTPLYSQNFNSYANGATPAGWNNDGDRWAVEAGNYTYTSTTYGGWTASLYEGQTFTNFRYTINASGVAGCQTGQSPPVLAIVFRATNRANNYYFWGDIDKIQIVKYVTGIPYVLATKGILGGIQPATNHWFNMTVDVVGTNITAVWDNTYTITTFDSQFASGYIGVATYNCNSEFNNVIVSSLGRPVPSFERTALLNVYNSRADLQTAFPEAATGTYTNLVNWAYGVVSQQWVDGSYDALAPYAYWYALMNTYDTSPDLQVAFPNAYYSTTSYRGLINWAGGVVTQKWTDGRYNILNTYGYWYDLMSTYNARSDLQSEFSNVYSNSTTANYLSLINWAGGVVLQKWVDGSYTSLQPFGYWYGLMMVYNTSPDLQSAFPNAYASQSAYQSLINWAGGVVTQQWKIGRAHV